MEYFFKNKFQENIRQFKAYLAERDYPKKVIDNPLSEVKFKLDVNGPSSNREKKNNKILPCVITQCYPPFPHLKEILTNKWQLVQKQSLLREILK